ncbi:homoserine kinase [Aureococcus anophagefferens]|uniref:Homoserine kinase n=1 Tax=Aureococcus anophagefferens TaxID=44056 RepID=A0ABR1FGH2_AURAN
MLKYATEDMLHQPQRATIYPHLIPMVTAGAHGAFLSGAGPTVLAICSGATGADIFTQAREERQEMKVAEAMRSAVNALPAKADQWKDGKFYICSPCMQGAHVVAADPPLSDTMATFGTLDGML